MGKMTKLPTSRTNTSSAYNTNVSNKTLSTCFFSGTLKQIVICTVALFAILVSFNIKAQTLRGTVKDNVTGETLPYATIVVLSTDKNSLDQLVAATTTDTVGNFEIKNVPTGRYTIEARFVGYEPERILEVLISGKKEVLLDFKLRELLTELAEVTIKPTLNKARALNSTAVAGAMMISVEEAERFAGSYDDIGRVVKRYVGTTGSNDNAGISTHGNSPMTTMYRIEGIEVPAPLHFYGTGSHGTGEISALNVSLLANSDYYTAAPPAEMGNTMGGVMDLKLRNGNAHTWENSVKLSTVGLALTSEGPISQKHGSSYLISYRYGLSKLTNDLGLSVLEGDQADYHDLVFKLNFPIDNSSSISLWGLGFWDHAYMDWANYSKKWESLYDQDDMKARINTALGGITYDKGFGNGWRLRTDLSVSQKDSKIDDRYVVRDKSGSLIDYLNYNKSDFGPAVPYLKADNSTLWLTAAVSAQKRFSSDYLLKFGSSFRNIDYNKTYKMSSDVYSGDLDDYLSKVDKAMQQVDAYVTNNLRFAKWTFNAGLHLSGWTLAKDWTLQPRFSTEYKPKENHTLAFGYGITTRIESYDTYFVPAETINGVTINNRDLKPMRSHQFVLNYKWQVSSSINLTSEAWTEFQSAVPVSPYSTYTSLNRTILSDAELLVNEGRGRNYGISFGAEYYMTNGLYWLANGSVFKSEYRAIDKVWRHTYYDRGWTANVAGGKEWTIKNKNVFSVNVAASVMGGLRRTPFDQAMSYYYYNVEKIPDVAYMDDLAMSKKHKTVVDLSLNISYRIHGKKFDQIIGCDYVNILNSKEPLYDYFNYRTNKAFTVMSCYSIPNFNYTILF